MRFLIDFSFPVEPFNSYVRDGSAGERLEKVLGAIKPEAVYFTENNGGRGGVMIVNMESASEIPRVAEPLFLQYEADIRISPCMSPEDLATAGLDELGEQFG
jgi:hypothetical protein